MRHYIPEISIHIVQWNKTRNLPEYENKWQKMATTKIQKKTSDAKDREIKITFNKFAALIFVQSKTDCVVFYTY